jgi:hypothetical protein
MPAVNSCLSAVSAATAVVLINCLCINEKKRTGPRSFMDLGTVRESGGPVKQKTDPHQVLIKKLGVSYLILLSFPQFLSVEAAILHVVYQA